MDSAVGGVVGGGKTLNFISTNYPTTGNIDLNSNYIFVGDAALYAPDTQTHAD